MYGSMINFGKVYLHLLHALGGQQNKQLERGREGLGLLVSVLVWQGLF